MISTVVKVVRSGSIDKLTSISTYLDLISRRFSDVNAKTAEYSADVISEMVSKGVRRLRTAASS